MITIRPGTEKDIPVLFELIKAFADFQQTPEKVQVTIAQMQADKDLLKCFVAEETETTTISGFASYFFAYYSWSGKCLYLDDLYVKDEYRGLHAGSLLMQAVIDFARANDCRKMRWLVSKWNSRAQAFYKQLGATIDESDIVCDLVL